MPPTLPYPASKKATPKKATPKKAVPKKAKLPLTAINQEGVVERGQAFRESLKVHAFGDPKDLGAETANVAAQEDPLAEPLLVEGDGSSEISTLLEAATTTSEDTPIDTTFSDGFDHKSQAMDRLLHDGRPAPEPVKGRKDTIRVPPDRCPPTPPKTRAQELADECRAEAANVVALADSRPLKMEINAMDEELGGMLTPAPDGQKAVTPPTAHPSVVCVIIPAGMSISISTSGDLTIAADGRIQV